jgi:hypothetical protein
METGLRFFHEQHDRRAIFLRLYHKMTLEVHAAINGCRDYRGREVFMDPGWVRRLSGRFSTLYFRSLEAPPSERAWTLAYEVAARPGSSVVENALLGINAHINFDLPRAIAQNLKGDDVGDFMTMQKRKFDHDQVNNLLVRTLNPVQSILAKDYEPGIAAADWLLGNLDERVSEAALRHYRERVWWDALAYASAPDEERRQIVYNKLEWQSHRLAERLSRTHWMWRTERALNAVIVPFRRARWAATPIEERCRDDHQEIGRPLSEIGRSPAPM